jgi:hypothetical protein
MDAQREAVAIKRQVGYQPGELPQFGGLRGREIVSYLGGMRAGVDAGRVKELASRFDLDLVSASASTRAATSRSWPLCWPTPALPTGTRRADRRPRSAEPAGVLPIRPGEWRGGSHNRPLLPHRLRGRTHLRPVGMSGGRAGRSESSARTAFPRAAARMPLKSSSGWPLPSVSTKCFNVVDNYRISGDFVRSTVALEPADEIHKGTSLNVHTSHIFNCQ